MIPGPTTATRSAPSDPDRMKVGTLTYTKAGLMALFAWLLWGDFCFIMHEQVVNNVLPLAYKRNGAPNFLMGILLTSVPAVLNFTLNPIISTASDRTRTRWGRRIPYLLFSAPVNAVFLILLAFSEDIGRWLASATHWSPTVTIVTVIAICFVLFRMTDLFVATVYYYLFNDVVPKAYLARFLALFRVVGTLAGATFNWFFLKHAEDHMREIFLGAGILYLVGYTLMCLKVKEGEYPPPPVGMNLRRGVWAIGRTFLRECFSRRFYWIFFLSNAAWAATSAMHSFGIFLNRDSLGLTLGQIGRIHAVSGVCSAVLVYLASIFVDRIHPLRFMLWTVVLQSVLAVASLNWLFWDPTPRAVWFIVIGLTCVALPLGAAHNAAHIPLYMRLLPKERYGQLASADAMVRSLAVIVGGVVAGGFLDLMKWVHHGSNFAYRYIPVWQLVFTCATAVLLFRLHREWLQLGGLKGYAPPNVEGPPTVAEGGVGSGAQRRGQAALPTSTAA